MGLTLATPETILFVLTYSKCEEDEAMWLCVKFKDGEVLTGLRDAERWDDYKRGWVIEMYLPDVKEYHTILKSDAEHIIELGYA